MNKTKLTICAFIAALALTACDKNDNPAIPDEPIEPPTEVNLDDPQEEVTDQPALSRTK